MNLHELAVETAEKQATSEAEAFEQATSCIVPAEFKVNDEVEQAFRAGLTARKSYCDDLRIEQIAAHYGFTSQADMAIEECSELIQAICKLRRGYSENHYTNLLEEVADVLIMARQLRYLLGYEEIDRTISEKLNRQIRRINDEKECSRAD